MSSLLLAIAAIAGLCGPRVQNESGEVLRTKAKECQVQMIKCVKAKAAPVDESLVACMQEVK